ncbi:MAG: hypothetical protein II208_02425 [Alphaproteobacteria bacterium]|nr:hypothetical protein [Alphaproteobacteria bacterium]
MIDTVVLSIPVDKINITNYELFSPSARGLFEPPYYKLGRRGYFECFLNPKIEETNLGYHPRFTLSKRMSNGGFSITLKIELSLPKLLYGNNFNELEDCDLESIVQRLHFELLSAGIIVDIDNVLNARVTGIHYGKNIILTNISVTALVVRSMGHLNITKRLDAAHTDFRNDGHAIRYHTNHYELTFYDKIKDLEQSKISEKRAIETDNNIQLNLFSSKTLQTRPEILRMECILNNTRNIKHILTACNINIKDLTLQTLFKKEFARTILQYFWNKYVTPSMDIIAMTKQDPDIIYIKLISAGLKESEALKCCGALILIKQIGIRGFKQLLTPNGNTYARLCKTIQQANFDDNHMYSTFLYIKQCIDDFKSIKNY